MYIHALQRRVNNVYTLFRVVFRDGNDAYRYAEKLKRSSLIEKLNAGRPEINSVLSREQYSAVDSVDFGAQAAA